VYWFISSGCPKIVVVDPEGCIVSVIRIMAPFIKHFSSNPDRSWFPAHEINPRFGVANTFTWLPLQFTKESFRFSPSLQIGIELSLSKEEMWFGGDGFIPMVGGFQVECVFSGFQIKCDLNPELLKFVRSCH
jgi:hypothetical protein